VVGRRPESISVRHAQVRFGQVDGRIVLVEEDDEPGAAVLGDGSLGTLRNVETLRGVEISGSDDTITMPQGLINISFHQATIRRPIAPLLRG
jgi:hypothetical protein